jgi:hypothetical protein
MPNPQSKSRSRLGKVADAPFQVVDDLDPDVISRPRSTVLVGQVRRAVYQLDLGESSWAVQVQDVGRGREGLQRLQPEP